MTDDYEITAHSVQIPISPYHQFLPFLYTALLSLSGLNICNQCRFRLDGNFCKDLEKHS